MGKASKVVITTKVRSSRAAFEEAIERATAARAELPAALIESVRKKFEALEQEIASSDERELREGDTRLGALIGRAEELERLRAYVVPKEEILIEGLSSVSDMNNWAVPQAVLDQLHREVMPQLRSANVLEARGALRSLYEVYDYWEWWIEHHARSMKLAAQVMLALLIAFVTASVFLLHGGHVYSGIFCAGTAGALLSVLAKLPPVLSYGAANAYFYRIVGRVAIGIAASMIGMGLLASGLISIQMSERLSVATMLDGKDLLCKTADSTSPTPGATGQPASCAPDDHRFSKRAVLLLMAIAMLFGFSERALSSFENKVFPTTSTTMIVQTGPRQPGEAPGEAPAGSGGALPAETSPPAPPSQAEPAEPEPAQSAAPEPARPAEPDPAQPAGPRKDMA